MKFACTVYMLVSVLVLCRIVDGRRPTRHEYEKCSTGKVYRCRVYRYSSAWQSTYSCDEFEHTWFSQRFAFSTVDISWIRFVHWQMQKLPTGNTPVILVRVANN